MTAVPQKREREEEEQEAGVGRLVLSARGYLSSPRRRQRDIEIRGW